MNPVTQSKNTTILPVVIALTLVCFAFSPTARATCQDACLTNNSTAQGDNALVSNTGFYNTAFGFSALFSNTSGFGNTATGASALENNTTGFDNTANGSFALFSNTSGGFNTAVGWEALDNNTAGDDNTAVGLEALQSNTTGSFNTAVGLQSLNSNRSDGNTAVGWVALQQNTTGGSNTAVGLAALEYNSTGSFNTANGALALLGDSSSFSTGSNNTAIGYEALVSYTTGNNNTAIGYQALNNNTTGINNIALGAAAGSSLTTGKNNIAIGNPGFAGEANKIRIGTTGVQKATFIAGISGVTVPAGVGVIVGTDGKLGTVVSSARFKDAIKPMDKASEAILALQPVTFRYKSELDPNGIPQFGLVAEEVEKVNPDLVARDEHGKPYTVRYEAVNAMLLNEFLKEHKAFVEEQRKVQELEANAVRQQKQIEVLTTGLQKMSAQLELSKSAPRTVLNDQ